MPLIHLLLKTLTQHKVQNKYVQTVVPGSEGQVNYTIDGDAILDMYAPSASYTGEANGYWIGDDWYTYSDRELKENEASLAASKIGELAVKTYTKDGVEFAGFVAQDVEEVFPNSVRTAKNGMKGHGLKEILAHAVKRIQEQDERIAQLEALIVP